MYNQSKNMQVYKSMELITEAFLKLLEKDIFEDITISQICLEAEVGRKTFYRNFKYKTDIIEYYIDKMYRRHDPKKGAVKIDVYKELKESFDDLYLHKDFLRIIEKNDLFFLITKTFPKHIEKFLNVDYILRIVKNATYKRYVIGYITATICSIIELCISNDFYEDTDFLATLATDFLSSIENPVTHLD